jgi:adenylate cyclase class IV
MSVEICLKSMINFDELKQLMLQKGFKIQEDFVVNDIYMISNGIKLLYKNKDYILKNNILVRETVGKKIFLIKKIKKYDNNDNVVNERSVKCMINSKQDGYNFLKNIGYKKIFELIDHNILFTNGVNEIYIQGISDLGAFVEMEDKNLLLSGRNGNDINELLETIKKYELPLDYSNICVKKAELMFNKIFGGNDE